jgi:hypothetical protein
MPDALSQRIPEARSAADIVALLKKPQIEPVENSEDLRDRYRQAASVLVALADPDNFQPVGGKGKPGEGRRLLNAELVKATARKFEGYLMLKPDARRVGMASLRTNEQRQQALDANPQERIGEIQRQLENYLFAKDLNLSQQSRDQLQATLQVSTWLYGVLDGLPDPDQVRALIDLHEFTASFEALAGDSIFRGRQKELDQLRSYVGVVEPASLLKRLSEKAFRWARPERRPAVSISGPGGIGKSALVARFMLEHLRLPAQGRIPFAYLDFDRPGLSISEPGTLLAEMLRQIDLQFYEEGHFRRLHDFFKSVMGSGGMPEQSDASSYNSQVRSVIADLVGAIDQFLGPRPYVIVLDTFEEVQYRGEHRASPFWELLDYLQRTRPFLRVIISGRARADTLILADRSPEHIELGDLDNDAAIAYLQNRGVSDPAVASALVRQVGGVPLSLKLAASLLNRESGGRESLQGIASKSKFWGAASDEEIQGELFSRILGHIHEPAVQRLAHPGFAVRRVSPAVILNVLNEPCGLAISTENEAGTLFEELRQETSLVVADTADGSLVHRTDLRRVMLKLLVRKAPAQVEAIHRNASKWYSNQTGWRAKAEQLYHRLQLNDLSFDRGFHDPEVRSSLQFSISELPASSQTYLATLGYQVSDEILMKASQEEREISLAAQIENLLPYGRRSCERARTMLDSIFWSDHASPLFRSAARIALQQERDGEAAAYLDQGLVFAMSEGRTRETLELLCEQAWLLRSRTQLKELNRSLPDLDEHARRLGDLKAIFQHRVQAYETEMAQFGSGRTPNSLLRDAAEIVAHLSADDLWDVFPLMDSVTESLHNQFPEAYSRVVELIGAFDGPFQRVQLPESRRATALLSELISEGRSTNLAREDYEVDNGAATRGLIQELAAEWPYRVLRVKPPYSQETFEASEIATA